MGVTWKLPGLFKDIDAEKCYSEIQGIGESATAKQIVERARDEESELHHCFTWDDSVAAELYREDQARLVVRSLVFTKSDKSKEPTKVRVMHIADEPHIYKHTVLIMQNKTEYEAMLERAIGELRAFQAKYKTLTELEEVFNAIDALG